MTRSLCTLERERDGEEERERPRCYKAVSRLAKGTNPKATSIPAKKCIEILLYFPMFWTLEQAAQALIAHPSQGRTYSKLLQKNQTGLEQTKTACIDRAQNMQQII